MSSILYDELRNCGTDKNCNPVASFLATHSIHKSDAYDLCNSLFDVVFDPTIIVKKNPFSVTFPKGNKITILSDKELEINDKTYQYTTEAQYGITTLYAAGEVVLIVPTKMLEV